MKRYLSPPMLAATLSPQGRQLKARLEHIFTGTAKRRGIYLPVLVLAVLACGALVACVPQETAEVHEPVIVPPTVRVETVPALEPKPLPQPVPETEAREPEPLPLPEEETESEPQPLETEESTTDSILMPGGTVVSIGGTGEVIRLEAGETVVTKGGIEITAFEGTPPKEGPEYDTNSTQPNNGHLQNAVPVEGYTSPLSSSYTVSQEFGTRTHPVTGQEVTHYGVDLATGYGVPVYAVADGTVEQAGYNEVYGNHIVVRHEDGSTSLYGHLSGFYVEAGDTVVQREHIGHVGDSGMATGAHLHLELRNAENMAIDPTDILG